MRNTFYETADGSLPVPEGTGPVAYCNQNGTSICVPFGRVPT